MKIYCAYCAETIDFRVRLAGHGCWHSSASGLKFCRKECKDASDILYYKELLA